MTKNDYQNITCVDRDIVAQIADSVKTRLENLSRLTFLNGFQIAWPSDLCETLEYMNAGTFGQEDSGTARKLRPMLLGVFILGSVGTLIELLLLGHTEEVFQLTPLALLTVSLTVLGMWFMSGGVRILRAFQVLMVLCLVSGGLGIYLHYRSNVEFELEMDPSAHGRALVWESLTGAMPALAPGTMFQLGLIGLLYTYRHPALRPRPKSGSQPGETL